MGFDLRLLLLQTDGQPGKFPSSLVAATVQSSSTLHRLLLFAKPPGAANILHLLYVI